jgi:hypothetical protein
MYIDGEGGSIHHTFLILALDLSPREWTLVPSEEKARWAQELDWTSGKSTAIPAQALEVLGATGSSGSQNF